MRDCLGGQIMNPHVSILIPAFNAQQWIADTLRSAIAQTWESKEIIVVDDGSNLIAFGFSPKAIEALPQREIAHFRYAAGTTFNGWMQMTFSLPTKLPYRWNLRSGLVINVLLSLHRGAGLCIDITAQGSFQRDCGQISLRLNGYSARWGKIFTCRLLHGWSAVN